jgi:hypothetical protein
MLCLGLSREDCKAPARHPAPWAIVEVFLDIAGGNLYNDLRD